VRPGLHHLEERVPGEPRSDPRRHGAPLRQRPDARHRVVQPLLGLDLQHPPHPRGRDGVAQAAGAVVPSAPRVPGPASRVVRRAGLLHVSLRAHRARPAGRPGAKHPGPHGARRAGHPPVDLRDVFARPPPSPTTRRSRRFLATSPELAAGGETSVRRDSPQHHAYPRGAGDVGQREDEPASAPSRPTARGAAFGAATACTARSCSTAAASTRARAARS
jgi:hypothetical protein